MGREGGKKREREIRASHSKLEAAGLIRLYGQNCSQYGHDLSLHTRLLEAEENLSYFGRNNWHDFCSTALIQIPNKIPTCPIENLFQSTF